MLTPGIHKSKLEENRMHFKHFLRDFVERLIRRMKRDSEYVIPEWVPTSALVEELRNRGLMAIRGLLMRRRFGKVCGLLFVGKGVRFRSPELIRLGRSVSIHDHVYIDGLCHDGIQLGDNVTIRENSIIECTGVLRMPGEALIIGNNVGISQNAFIGVRGKVVIGNNVIMGPNVTIYAANHIFDDPDRLINEQRESREGINIEDDCWLGTGCVVLDGVRISRGSVIAAGCIVTKSIPPYSVVGGIPGRMIRTRGNR